MAEAITANYAQENEDWAITVSDGDKTLTARAPGIIAARDRADQLVEKLAGDQHTTTVVHLLNGSALEFTAAYMNARMARAEGSEAGQSSAAQEAKGLREEPAAAKASTETTAESSPETPGTTEDRDVSQPPGSTATQASSATDEESQAPSTPASSRPETAGAQQNGEAGARVEGTTTIETEAATDEHTDKGAPANPPARA